MEALRSSVGEMAKAFHTSVPGANKLSDLERGPSEGMLRLTLLCAISALGVHAYVLKEPPLDGEPMLKNCSDEDPLQPVCGDLICKRGICVECSDSADCQAINSEHACLDLGPHYHRAVGRPTQDLCLRQPLTARLHGAGAGDAGDGNRGGRRRGRRRPVAAAAHPHHGADAARRRAPRQRVRAGGAASTSSPWPPSDA